MDYQFSDFEKEVLRRLAASMHLDEVPPVSRIVYEVWEDVETIRSEIRAIESS